MHKKTHQHKSTVLLSITGLYVGWARGGGERGTYLFKVYLSKEQYFKGKGP